MERKVNITINGKSAQVNADYTIMQAADEMGIKIPRLCFLKDINENSSCRVCVVEVAGIRTLKNSCSVKVSEGMVVNTNTPRVRRSVKDTLELMAANHRFDCWNCPREHNCEFLSLLRKYGVTNKLQESGEFSKREQVINESCAIVFDSSKCILCGRCIGACEKLAGTNVLNYNNRGFKTVVGTPLNLPIDTSGCIYCGKCIGACPTGAIKEKEEIEVVEDLLASKEKYVVVQVAPAVRAALGEEFGYPIGTNVEGKMYRALKELGFNDITDVNFGADVTIMEEGTELLGRLQKFMDKEKVALPMITSCSPGWIRYIEQYYPEYLDNLSTTKSPQQIQGALTKHYYAEKIGVAKEKIHVVSVMPCIAKKYEARRPEMETDGIRDVDSVLTTRELARLIKRAGIDFNSLEDYVPTSPLAKYTGAGVIFGATGGVMEAALRTVADILDEKAAKKLDFTPVRGVDADIKEATITLNGMDVNVAVVHGTKNVPALFDLIKKGEKQYHFVEVMACTGGCVNGGGQPVVTAYMQEKVDVRKERAKVLYQIDDNSSVRKSHKNEAVNELYQSFLKEPNSELAHHLLHTHYSKKEIFKL